MFLSFSARARMLYSGGGLRGAPGRRSGTGAPGQRSGAALRGGAPGQGQGGALRRRPGAALALRGGRSVGRSGAGAAGVGKITASF